MGRASVESLVQLLPLAPSLYSNRYALSAVPGIWLTWASIDVVIGQLVTMLTVSASCECRYWARSSQSVLSHGDRFEMVWIYAMRHAAQVIQGKAVRYWTD